ncbi:MAG: aminotransferase class I/II-fold pyridoxal phosphate-dependent enzyme [Planctomycetes bacterium]|nr:aminotransferase class I/II-fold pyridoxal phosphate-dependent enzyme [Planctomycetota bacterium]
MDPLDRRAARRAHLDRGNPLRSLTEVIDKVIGGINLGQGVCDLDPPAPLVRGAVESIGGPDRQTYTPYKGLPGLRTAIAARLRKFNRLDVDAEQVGVTLGASGAFFAAAMTLLEPGDEVILFEPFYSYHRSSLLLCGAVPVCVRLPAPTFALDVDALRRAITDRTRAIVLNTPANPTGKVFDTAELEAIALLVRGTGIVVFTDEVYEYMCFDGREHVSPATIEGLHDRCVTIGSYSKTFSITGWRIGYLAGPAELVDAVGLVCDQIHVCAPRPMQRGVTRALQELPESYYSELQALYESKRDRFCDALEDAGFGVVRPAGAYYVMADYRDVLGDLAPYDAVLKLIERVGINGVPGDVFYEDPTGVRSIRFQFAVTPDVLDDACARLRTLSR